MLIYHTLRPICRFILSLDAISFASYPEKRKNPPYWVDWIAGDFNELAPFRVQNVRFSLRVGVSILGLASESSNLRNEPSFVGVYMYGRAVACGRIKARPVDHYLFVNR